MRAAAAVTVVLCSLIAGIELVRRKQLGCKLISETAELCLYMQSCIRYEQTRPELMLRTYLSDNMLCRECCKAMDGGECFREAWKVSAEKYRSFLGIEEYELVKRLGAELGSADISGEIMRLEHIYSRLCRMYSERRTELEEKRRMHISVSLLAGIFIAIMMF